MHVLHNLALVLFNKIASRDGTTIPKPNQVNIQKMLDSG